MEGGGFKMSWWDDLWNNFWSVGTTPEDLGIPIEETENHLENLIKALIKLLENVVEFITILPKILEKTLNFFLEVTAHTYEIIIFVEILILSFVLIQFHNNEEGLSGYSQIIQIFKTLIKYHYNLINFTIYAFISVFTIIFNIIRSIRG